MSATLRSLKISYVIIKCRLIELLPEDHLPKPLQFSIWLSKRFRKPSQSDGERLRLALESLGPVFVKFGQILSTRRDFIPINIADEIKQLQDNVKPFPNKIAINIIEKAFKKPIGEIFKTFDENPIASASIAQVYQATLSSGEDAVVKIIRPNIKKIIQKDIKILYRIAKLTERWWSEGKRLRAQEVVAEFEQTIFNELDLIREGANTSQLRRNFKETTDSTDKNNAFPLLYIPKIYWDYTHTNILVMEHIHGIAVTNIDLLNQHRINLKKLSERGVKIFFTQVFKHNFFHADMHPGNIFVSAEHPENPQYIAVDCGIIGSLTPDDQNYIARNLLAFFNQDYHQVAQLHIECGWVGPDTSLTEFEADIRSVCEPIFAKPLKDISLGQILIRLFQISRRHKMQIQPQLILLQKTLLNIEGLGREIYPELDLWNTAKPFLEDWMKQRLHPKELFKNFQQHSPAWLDQFPQLPQIALNAIQQINTIEKQAKTQQKTLELLLSNITDKPKLKSRKIIGLGIIASIILFYGLFLANVNLSEPLLKLIELDPKLLISSAAITVFGLYLLNT